MNIDTYYQKLENLRYKDFLNSFLQTNYYNRLISINDTNINRLLENFSSIFKDDNINNSIFSQRFSILFFAENANDQEKEEIQNLLDSTNLDVLYKIPDKNYLNEWHYNSEYDYIVPNILPPSPYPSWSYDIHTNRYWPPTPKPELTENNMLEGLEYKWEESSLSWILVKIA